MNAEFGGYTALLNAAGQRENIEVIRQLLDAGANVNAQDKDGMTALMQASRDGDVETVRVLMARGAKISLKDKHGHTALWWGRSNKVVVALLKRVAAGGRKQGIPGPSREATAIR